MQDLRFCEPAALLSLLLNPSQPLQPAAVPLELAAHPSLPLLALLLRPRDLHDLLLPRSAAFASRIRTSSRACLHMSFARFSLHRHGNWNRGLLDFRFGFHLGLRVRQDASSPTGNSSGRGAGVAAWLGTRFDLRRGGAFAAYFADFALLAGGEQVWAPGCLAVVVATAVADGAVDKDGGGGVCSGAAGGFGA